MLLMLYFILLVFCNLLHSMDALITMPKAAKIETNLREKLCNYYVDTANLHINLGSKQVLVSELLELLEEHLIKYHESIQRPYIKELLEGGVIELVRSLFIHDSQMFDKISLIQHEKTPRFKIKVKKVERF